MPPRLYTSLIHLWLLATWPSTAMAAVSLLDFFKGSTIWLAVVLAVISSLSGLTSLILSLEDELKVNHKLPEYLKLYIIARILGSWLGGLIGAALSNSFELNFDGWGLLLSVIGFSFAGIHAVKRLTSGLMTKQFPQESPPAKEPLA